ncbi:unnamed protein product [Pleuronectes platessa]|uniref:Uncharacterized protein n=1 Tax=Pleuronectes platessa TaxID=8262 RepID=A0A9N7UT35_PLEPL|nr:unnamed protein product [Pleuronectes platessa]
MSYDQLLKEEDLSGNLKGLAPQKSLPIPNSLKIELTFPRSPQEFHSQAEITDFLFHDPHNCATADHPSRRDEAEFRSKSKRRKFAVRAGILRLTTRFTGLLENPRATRKQHREGHMGRHHVANCVLLTLHIQEICPADNEQSEKLQHVPTDSQRGGE